MRMNHCFGSLLCLLAMLSNNISTAEVAPEQQTKAPVPRVPVPVPPQNTQQCLFHIDEYVKGIASSSPIQYDTQSPCSTGAVGRSNVQMRFEIVSERCNEDGAISSGSKLEVDGTTTRRRDGLSYLTGNFNLLRPSGDVLYSGTLSATYKIGTHPAPFGTDSCGSGEFLEGWLIGTRRGGGSRRELRAFLVVRGYETKTADGKITGVIIEVH